MGWKPTSDIFSGISEDDVIEVYTLDSIQRYRSANFFKYISYSVGEIITYPWYELVEHPKELMPELMRIAQGMASNTIKQKVIPTSESFCSQECFSRARNRIKSISKGIAPVTARDSEENVAMIAVWNITRLNPGDS
jgi:hypothetical protein